MASWAKLPCPRPSHDICFVLIWRHLLSRSSLLRIKNLKKNQKIFIKGSDSYLTYSKEMQPIHFTVDFVHLSINWKLAIDTYSFCFGIDHIWTLVSPNNSQDSKSVPLLLCSTLHKFQRCILTDEALLKSKVQHFVLEMLTWNAIKYSNNNLLNLSG